MMAKSALIPPHEVLELLFRNSDGPMTARLDVI
jgi:hypothetical protein